MTPGKRYNNALARRAAERRRRMATLRRNGLTLREIGQRFGGISAQRVHAILGSDVDVA